MVKENIANSRVKLTFDVTADEFEKALDKAFVKDNANVTIKGFRKGKATRSMFEKTYGVESLFATALDFILEDKIQEAVKDEELIKKAIGQFEPILEEKVTRGADFKVSLAIDVYPEVVLPAYKGVEVKKQVLTVTDEEVENAVKALAKKDATKEVKEGAIEKGDFATFDFLGKVNGEAFEGGKADNYELQIGSGQFIPGFEDQMIGMKVEETKDLNVKFPENYGSADLAGKDAVFTVTVHEIKVEKFPEFTDEYVKGLNIEGVSTLAELKANKKAELEASKATSEKDRQVNDIINTILDNTNIEMPKALVDQRYNAIKSQYEQQAKMYNIPFETFIQIMGATLEQFEDVNRKQAARQALFDLVASKIIEEEKLTPTEEQIKARALAETKDEKQAEELAKKNYARYYSMVAYDSMIDMLLANAKEI